MRIALVGLGDAGLHLHLPALCSLPSVTVVGGCDPSQDRRDAAGKQVPTFSDFDAMVAQTRPEVIVIATPPDSHEDYCVRSLRADAHVFCEKPFVSSLDAADRVIAAGAAAGRQVAVNHEFREMPIFRAVHTELKESAAPLVFLQMWQLMDMPPHAESNWRGHMAERALFEAGVHLVDLAMVLFGEQPVSVQATTYGDREPAVDAVVTVTLEFSSGRLAQLTQSRLCKGTRQYFEVRADTTQASLRASFGGRARVSTGLFRDTRPHFRFEYGQSGLAWKEVGNRRTFLARNPKAPTVAATRTVLEKTLEAFRTGGKPPTSGERARDVLKVIAACYHSAREGRRVSLDDAALLALSSRRMGSRPQS
jgi:predicted dehydrogenase